MVFPFPLFSSHYVDISSSPWHRPRLLPTTTNEVYADGSCLSLVTSFVSLPSCFPSWLSYRYAASRWPETRRDAFVICSHSVIPLPFMDLIIVNCLCHPAHSMESLSPDFFPFGQRNSFVCFISWHFKNKLQFGKKKKRLTRLFF